MGVTNVRTRLPFTVFKSLDCSSLWNAIYMYPVAVRTNHDRSVGIEVQRMRYYVRVTESRIKLDAAIRAP